MHLDFGKTQEEFNVTVRNVLSQMNYDLNGNGDPGLLSRFNTFFDQNEAIEKEREKQHKANTVRLNLIIGILGLLVAFLSVLVAVKGLSKTGEIFHSHDTEPTLSSVPSNQITDTR